MAKKEYKLKTKFAAESESTAVALATETAAALFTREDGSTVDESKLQRLNAPRLLKPDQVPVWTPANPIILTGELIQVLPSPNSQIKGFVLWMKLPSGMEITFPCTGVIRSALAPGCKIDDKNEAVEEKSTAALKLALDKHVGRTLYFKRTSNTMNKNFKREQFMFDVWTSKA